MSATFDVRPLNTFFQEVKDQLGVELKYFEDHPKFPIQLANTPEGLPRAKCLEVFNFIKGQVDLRDNEIGSIFTSKISGHYLVEISFAATKALAEVYALSSFYDADEDNPS